MTTTDIPWYRQRHWRLLLLAAFLGVGFLIFFPRMPQDIRLYVDLPPTLRYQELVVARQDIVAVDIRLSDEGGAEVARVHLKRAGDLRHPRTGPALLSLKPQPYLVEAVAMTRANSRLKLQGRFEGAGEVIVSLK